MTDLFDFHAIRKHLENPSASHLKSFIEDITSTLENYDNHIFGRIQREQELFMSALDDQLKAIQDAQAAGEAKIEAIKADAAAALKKIADLAAAAAAVPTAGLTAEQQAALDNIQAHAASTAESLGSIDATLNPPAPAASPAADTTAPAADAPAAAATTSTG